MDGSKAVNLDEPAGQQVLACSARNCKDGVEHAAQQQAVRQAAVDEAACKQALACSVKQMQERCSMHSAAGRAEGSRAASPC